MVNDVKRDRLVFGFAKLFILFALPIIPALIFQLWTTAFLSTSAMIASLCFALYFNDGE